MRVYLAIAQSLLENASSGNYEHPVELLRKCQEILAPLGRSDEFLQLVGTFYAEFRRKRNFIKLLEKEKWL